MGKNEIHGVFSGVTHGHTRQISVITHHSAYRYCSTFGGNPASPSYPPPKDLGSSHGDGDPKAGMVPKELEDTLVMCGQASSATTKDLPGWFKDCMVKHTTDQYRQTIIRKWVTNNTFYDDAEVPLTEPLLKMIMKRAWVGKGGNVSRPSLLHAMEGISPFLMLDLSEDEVASINDEADLIQHASLVSVHDLRALKRKMKITIPVASEDFLLLLKKFANLVFALFSSQSPLFKCVRELITALKAYSREARRKMSLQTKGSILWIVLLQARQFGQGEVNVLCEFTTMHADLRAKRAQITHSEVPAELLANSFGTDLEDEKDRVGEEREQKRQKKENPNNWHPKLKEALTRPMAEAGNPSFSRVMNFIKKDAYGIIPKGSRVCTPNAIFGTCFNGDACHKRHVVLRDEQVPQVLSLLAAFVKEPKKVAKGP